MNEQLAALVKLQEFDLGLEALRKKGESLLGEREALNKEIADLKAGLEAGKAALTQLQLKKKQMELDIDGKDQQVKKFQGELNNVKTNDAYKTLLKEIEQAKTEKGALEDDLLVVLQGIEDAQKDTKVKEQTHKNEEQAVQGRIAAAEKALVELAAQAEEKKKLRDEFAAGVPSAARERYEAIRKGKGALAVAPVNGDSCGGCRQKLPLHVINDVNKNQSLVFCNSCSRILFSQQPSPSPSPAGS